MRKKLSVLLALALLATSAFGLAGPATAHPVTVGPAGGADAEWNNFAITPGTSAFNQKNVGRILRNEQGQGEYAWRDITSDGTTIPPSPGDARLVITETRQVDLRQFRMTGTPTDLYIYAQFAGLTSLSGGAVPELQVAIDVPGVNAAGNDRFVANAANPNTTITPTLETAWDYLIRTRFDDPQFVNFVEKSNNNPPVVHTSLADPGTSVGAGVLAANTNAIELRIPWLALGTAGGPRPNLRFYVATLRSDHQAPTNDSAPGVAVLDVISRAVDSDPLATPEDTITAFRQPLTGGGQGLRYSFEVNFDATSGEPYSPALLTELSLRPSQPSGSGVTAAQWFEVTNFGATPSDLRNYKVGDAGDPTSNEGMYSLSNVTGGIPVNGSIVVTRNRTTFGTLYPTVNLASVYSITTTGSMPLTPYSGWAGQDFSLPIRANETGVLRDQVLLLNGDDTIVDLIEYAQASTPIASWYPENVPVTVATPDASTTPPSIAVDANLIRCPAFRDTNNGPVDFVTVTSKAQHTPLTTACAYSDLYTSVAGPSAVLVDALNNTTQNYTVTYGNNRADVITGTVVVTLPRAMTLASATPSDPTLGQPAVTAAPDGRVVLTWSQNVASAFGTQGTIALVLNVPGGTAAEPATDLRATFTSSQVDTDATNNTTTYAITYSAQAFANVAVTIDNKNTDTFFPGGSILYGVTVTNSGPKQADNVTVEIDFPSHLTYNGNVSNGQGLPASVSGNKVTINLGAVPAGSPTPASVLIDVEFLVKTDAVVGTSTSSTATVKTLTTPETPTTDNTSTSPAISVGEAPAGPNVDVKVELLTTGTIKPGDFVSYKITVSNIGNLEIPVNQVTAIDDFPEDQVTFVDSKPVADVTVFPLAGTVRFSLNRALAKKGDAGDTVVIEARFQIKSTVANGATVVNSVNVPAVPGEVSLANNSASASVSISLPTTPNSYTALLPIVVK
jgi:uncharacterized repeat protein (TIGR01451 family)